MTDDEFITLQLGPVCERCGYLHPEGQGCDFGICKACGREFEVGDDLKPVVEKMEGCNVALGLPAVMQVVFIHKMCTL